MPYSFRAARSDDLPLLRAWLRTPEVARWWGDPDEQAAMLEEDLTEPGRIEAGVLAMAGDVWAWCEKTGFRARTVTVKIKWADFQQSTRSRSLEEPIDSQGRLNEVATTLIRSTFPPEKGVRLIGVTLSNFRSPEARGEAELPFTIESPRS